MSNVKVAIVAVGLSIAGLGVDQQAHAQALPAGHFHGVLSKQALLPTTGFGQGIANCETISINGYATDLYGAVDLTVVSADNLYLAIDSGSTNRSEITLYNPNLTNAVGFNGYTGVAYAYTAEVGATYTGGILNLQFNLLYKGVGGNNALNISKGILLGLTRYLPAAAR